MTRERIPAELRNIAQWVKWRSVKRNGKATKIPVQFTGEAASSTDPTTWASLESVVASLEPNDAGIGFVFTVDDPYCGIDLDGCREPANGEIAPWAQTILDEFASYAEVSPSGTGVKIFVQGDWPHDRHKVLLDVPKIGDKAPAIEVYDRARYFAVTGDQVGSQSAVTEAHQALDRLHARYFAADAPKTTNEWSSPVAVMERARGYLATLPPAIEGQNGSGACFRAACILVIDFALSESDALTLLSEWNACCVPPWSDKDLRHKIASAMKRPGPRGRLRDASPANYEKIRVPEYVEPPPQLPGMKFRRFPANELPKRIRKFVLELAAATGTDESWAGLAVLSVVAGAIGNRFVVSVKAGWTEPAIIWAALVGASGSVKSAVYRAAVKPLRDIYDSDSAAHRAELTAHEAGGGEGPKPTVRRILLGDVTVEKIAIILNENPGGVIACRDELAAWLGAHNRYKSGRGGDEAIWLSFYDADSVVVDRVSSDSIYVHRGAVSILGGIQPRTLWRLFGEAERDSGMLARFLLAYPPEREEKWQDAELSKGTMEDWRALIESLVEIEVDHDDEGRIRPRQLVIAPDAQQAAIDWVNWIGRERRQADDDLKAALAKIKGVAFRLALIIEIVGCVQEGGWPSMISAKSMQAGIKLARWFAHEARRVYRMFAPDGDHETRIVDVIDAMGGRVTPSDLVRRRLFTNVEDARRVLLKFDRQGLGRLERLPSGEEGGRPSEVFTLFDADEPPPARTETS